MKKKDKYIGGIVIASLIVVAVIIGYFKSQPKVYKDEDIFVDVPVSNENKSTAVSASKDKIVVEIKGEVKNPDVYIMGSDAIVKDLILEAGGITEKGDLSKVNQAMTLKKGDCITIPGKTEDNAISPEAKGTPSSNGASSQSAKTPSGKLDVNRASKEELKTVPGIGDVTAGKIIDYREKNGPFGSLEDLKKVGRIGDTTLKKFQDYLEVR
ncbi:MAG: ComEA family DNA-binding protein [Clostridium sp.]|uniref:ComEA family DNA-binding protein n=1 Tax=Clostridium sp. TaxID=1506 RepID=UPI002A851FBA|nr:ComEA family DNA-binding protein [Clostridium sp.]MDY5097362.1 ComEA family DNA-binding protein [Clostridium sp.]